MRILRISHGYSQADIAKIIGCTPAGYGKYELGTCDPSIWVLILLADLYHVSIDEIVGHEIKILTENLSSYSQGEQPINAKSERENMARLKKNFDIDYAKSLNIHFLTKRVDLLETFMDCYTVNDIYREISYLVTSIGISVKDLTRIFGVSRSGYYSWLQNGDLVHKRNAWIAKEIMNYEIPALDSAGYTAVTEYLHTIDNPELKKISVARVHRIMDEFEIIPEDLRNKKNEVLFAELGTYKAYNLPVAARKVESFAIPTKPCDKWCIDITQINTDDGAIYLCPVMDLYGRYILGYKVSLSLDKRLVRNAITKANNMAKKHYGEHIDAIILHSDRGPQFRSSQVSELEKKYNLDASMSRAHTPNDNACIESFFSSLKCEFLGRFHLDSISTATNLIDRYIFFYNNIRVHQTIHMPPCEMWCNGQSRNAK